MLAECWTPSGKMWTKLNFMKFFFSFVTNKSLNKSFATHFMKVVKANLETRGFYFYFRKTDRSGRCPNNRIKFMQTIISTS